MAISFLKSTISRLRRRIESARVRRIRSAEVKSFKEKQETEEAFDVRIEATRQVPLNQIVGSVGRYHDFDSRFRLKDYLPQERLQIVKKAMREGKPMPPVELYQIKDEYYVLDGNHRVSAAKEFGYDTIDAHIVEFIPSKNTFENILYLKRSEFNDLTGLQKPIELTELGHYARLKGQISRHRRFLEEERGEPVSFKSAALDWYKTIYCPLVGIIKKGRLTEAFRERTAADLYAYISYYQWERGGTRRYGSGIDQVISKDMEEFRKTMANKKEPEYPEMLREITAFVLMNVTAKREDRLIEKLFSLEEVREIHAVHGDVDILAKIVLKRDLVSSDAQMIGTFVSNRIRLLPGIISTQTLIPSISKIKSKEEE